jgi:4-azaleucine resistance transporter AzlC
MCDESFSINCSAKIPEGIDKGWFMVFVNLLNQCYWVMGAALGALLGKVIQINTKGIEFVLTALFVVIFIEQWKEAKNHIPALIGLGLTVVCLILIGSEHFIIPSMILIVALFMGLKKWGITL